MMRTAFATPVLSSLLGACWCRVIHYFVGRQPFSKLCLSVTRKTAAVPLFLLASQLSAQSAPFIFMGGKAASGQNQQVGRALQNPAPQNLAPQTPPTQPPSDGTNQNSETSSSAATPPVSRQISGTGEGQQTKRILGIAPNFQAVSANLHLPVMTVKQKLWLATEGTFDYSSFISVGIEAGVEQATKTYPEFHQGAAGYGRYYWHTFADSGIENYFTGAFLPILTHQDPRYYTLYHGSFMRRTAYAFSRLGVTKRDSGLRDFNYSEIIGSGIAAGVSSRYYPEHERQASEILERWASQLLNDGVGNVFEEFWPDIHQRLFHHHPANEGQ
jgi:hypothetical protein